MGPWDNRHREGVGDVSRAIREKCKLIRAFDETMSLLKYVTDVCRRRRGRLTAWKCSANKLDWKTTHENYFRVVGLGLLRRVGKTAAVLASDNSLCCESPYNSAHRRLLFECSRHNTYIYIYIYPWLSNDLQIFITSCCTWLVNPWSRPLHTRPLFFYEYHVFFTPNEGVRHHRVLQIIENTAAHEFISIR